MEQRCMSSVLAKSTPPPAGEGHATRMVAGQTHTQGGTWHRQEAESELDHKSRVLLGGHNWLLFLRQII